MKKIKKYKIIETLKTQAFLIAIKITICMMTGEDLENISIVSQDLADGKYTNMSSCYICYKDKIYYPKKTSPHVCRPT